MQFPECHVWKNSRRYTISKIVVIFILTHHVIPLFGIVISFCFGYNNFILHRSIFDMKFSYRSYTGWSLGGGPKLVVINHVIINQWKWNLTVLTWCLPSWFASFPSVYDFACCAAHWCVWTWCIVLVSVFRQRETNFNFFCNPVFFHIYRTIYLPSLVFSDNYHAVYDY
jgi:hypothetical protein